MASRQSSNEVCGTENAGKSFSWFRILYNLVYFLLLTGLFLGAVYLWRVFGQS